MGEKIAREVAEREFERFIEAMDIDADMSGFDEEDRKSFAQQRDRLISSIQSGALVINDAGEPTFTPQRSGAIDPITFFEPTGASLMAMDRKKKSEDVGKLYAAMGDMTRTSASLFSKMKMSDLKICIAITTLFLG